MAKAHTLKYYARMRREIPPIINKNTNNTKKKGFWREQSSIQQMLCENWKQLMFTNVKLSLNRNGAH